MCQFLHIIGMGQFIGSETQSVSVNRPLGGQLPSRPEHSETRLEIVHCIYYSVGQLSPLTVKNKTASHYEKIPRPPPWS